MNYAILTPDGLPYVQRLQTLEMYFALSIVAGAVFGCIAVWFLLKRFGATARPSLGPTSGIASLEFLMVLLPLLIIVLAFVQVSLMINAQLHVGYAAYAAGRSASTVIYEKTDNEEEGILNNAGTEGATKWTRIKRATAPALLPVSPGSATAAAKAYASYKAGVAIDSQSWDGVAFDSSPASVVGQLGPMVLHRGGDFYEGSRVQRGVVKSLYADVATEVWINGRNAAGEDKEGGQTTEPYDLSSEDTLTVDVTYQFWLNVPYAGRTMKTAMDWQFAFLDSLLVPTIELSETVVVSAWRKRKAF